MTNTVNEDGCCFFGSSCHIYSNLLQLYIQLIVGCSFIRIRAYHGINFSFFLIFVIFTNQWLYIYENAYMVSLGFEPIAAGEEGVDKPLSYGGTLSALPSYPEL